MSSKDKIILQGTDGVRGKVRLSGSHEAAGFSPVELFLKKGIISEEFVELYTYSVVKYLMSKGLIRSGDEVVIGWDPRDKGGVFTKRAVDGIKKAGGTVLNIGVVPTPLVPLYMSYRNAGCGIMITASHNPHDQNGIKIFLMPYGIKMLPEEDALLSAFILKQDMKEIALLPENGRETNCSSDAIHVFKRFLLDPSNSWIRDKGIISKTIMFIDSANGSYSKIASDVFKSLGLSQVTDIYNDTKEGFVNDGCGVVDFENVFSITADMADKNEGRFFNSKLIKAVFKSGRENREKIASGEVFVSASVFDADGDRFYRLDYNPISDSITVLNGDMVACHQARYLLSLCPERYKNGFYVNTIESDIEAALAMKKVGLDNILTAVGDKWILWNAALTSFRSLLSIGMEYSKDKDISDHLEDMIKKTDTLYDAADERRNRLSSLIDEVTDRRKRDKRFDHVMAKAEEGILESGGIRFLIGSENSGHTITIGYLDNKDGKRIPVFSGNGLKSAINTLVAVGQPQGVAPTCAGYFDALQNPFSAGYIRSSYIYYTNKSLVKYATKEWDDLDKMIDSECTKIFKGYNVSTQVIRDDLNILYKGVFDRDGNKIAAIYIRNSGTEEKTGLNIMGDNRCREKFIQVALSLKKYMAVRLKDKNSPDVILENRIMTAIYKGDNLVQTCMDEKNGQDVINRLLKIMENKEGLIIKSEKGYTLSPLGEHYFKEAVQ